MQKKEKAAILTGGGDCPGLNAVGPSVNKICQTGGNKFWRLK